MHRKFAEALLGTPTSSPSDFQLDVWAKTASKRSVDESVPLNDTISKIAQDNGLNRNFVERICEMSNMYTHNQLLPSEPEKRAAFGFPLADADGIAGRLSSETRPTVKMISDYAGPPKGLPGGGPTVAELFGVKDVKPHHGFDTPDKKRMLIVIEKKAALKQRAQDVMCKIAMMSETKEKELRKHVKQAVMRGADLEEIHKVACYAGVGDISEEVFPDIAKELNKKFLIDDKQLEKVAFKAPEELIDYDVPVRIINGRNAILSSLKDLKEYKDNLHTFQQGVMGVDREVDMLQQKIKEIDQ